MTQFLPPEFLDILETPTNKILLDMDGVLCDFVEAASDLFVNTHKEELYKRLPDEDIAFILTGSTDVSYFWNIISSYGERFWENIPEFVWSMKLYDACKNVATVRVVTAPPFHTENSTLIKNTISGKYSWIKKRKPTAKIIFTSDKELLATPDTLLIDDYLLNIQKFKEAGGKTLLFPAVYNKSSLKIEEIFNLLNLVCYK